MHFARPGEYLYLRERPWCISRKRVVKSARAYAKENLLLSEMESGTAKREPRLLGLSTPARIPLIPPLTAARWLLVLIVAAGIYFFNGFLVPVLAALIIGFASWPLYARLVQRCGDRTALAARDRKSVV